MILVDSDVIIDLFRDYSPAVAWLDSLEQSEIVLPGFVVMELIQGTRTKPELARVETILAPFKVIWPTPEVCSQALTVFARVYLSHNLGLLDALIGQLAVSLDEPLVTFNQRHYAAIPQLRTVQPYDRL